MVCALVLLRARERERAREERRERRERRERERVRGEREVGYLIDIHLSRYLECNI